MPKCDFNKVAKQLYWKHTSAWVFSSKFFAFFQSTFFCEHLWRAASASYSFVHICTGTCNYQTFICFIFRQKYIHIGPRNYHYSVQALSLVKQMCQFMTIILSGNWKLRILRSVYQQLIKFFLFIEVLVRSLFISFIYHHAVWGIIYCWNKTRFDSFLNNLDWKIIQFNMNL